MQEFACKRNVLQCVFSSPRVFSFTSRSKKPFYSQLYKALQEIDTFKLANNITGSIMY